MRAFTQKGQGRKYGASRFSFFFVLSSAQYG